MGWRLGFGWVWVTVALACEVASDEPVNARSCPAASECGDGIVGPDERCDDANANDADGCTAECQRPTITASPVVEMVPESSAAFVDADGSVLVANAYDRSIHRIGPDGRDLWVNPLDTEAARIFLSALLVGDEIVVVGNESGGPGVVWRFEVDGTPVSTTTDVAGRGYGDAELASDGGIIIVAGAEVERRAPDASVVWTHPFDPDATMSGMALATASDDSVFVAGGLNGIGDGAIVHVTPDAADRHVFAQGASGFFYGIDDAPDGGAVAVGNTGTSLFLARVDDDNDVIWTSTCSTEILVDKIAVIDDRIVLGGATSSGAGCTSGEGCPGERTTWVQHLALDGSVIATDAPGRLVASDGYPYETVLALGRHADGSVIVVAEVGGNVPHGAFLGRFPW